MPNINIGKKVQEFRNMRQMNLRQLSEKANLTVSMLSQIENKGANPSINTLRDIARALNVPIFKFFQDDVEVDKMIVRKGQNKILGEPNAEVTYKLLTPDNSGMIEFCLMEIPAGLSSSCQPHEHQGEETAYVIEGEVSIQICNTKEVLMAGDSIKIPPMNAHMWVNNSNSTVSVIFAITPPSF